MGQNSKIIKYRIKIDMELQVLRKSEENQWDEGEGNDGQGKVQSTAAQLPWNVEMAVNQTVIICGAFTDFCSKTNSIFVRINLDSDLKFTFK